MIYVNRNVFSSEIKLFSIFDGIEELIIDKNRELDIIKNIYDNDILLHNPENNLIYEIINRTNKNIFISYSYVSYEYLEVMRNNRIKEIYVYDNLDVLFLKQNKVNNYRFLYPTNKIHNIENKRSVMLCTNNIKDLSESRLKYMIELSKKGPVVYCGLKELFSKNEFDKIKKMIYSNIIIEDYPLLDLEKRIAESEFFVYFKNNKLFPVEVFYAAKCGVIPFIYSTDRYFKWLPGYLHFENSEEILETLNSTKKHTILNDIKNKLEQYDKNLCS